ncbi:histone-lysine N-methyltransferase PR-Set7 isoform X1 [Odontomachus brunneus]|uniref:histone-lysine N-methyltransferase PR-Set7 isoform X1 n=1 Tax=Odontomachus brunneus TaxID=486640 RepID=UPI0013F251A1|nr:histone-lysine N-methyltransferase PR-Set7 isoform X1 [Odontomachus brunneus]
MNKATRAASRRIGSNLGNTTKVNQTCGASKDIALQSNLAAVKNQKKFDSTKKLTNIYFSKTQSTSETCKSLTDKAYSCGQDSNGDIMKEESPSLVRYFFENAIVPKYVSTINEIISDVEQFKTDETPVAVPVHGPSTPHRINMPSLEDEATMTKEKQPVMVTLRSPLQIIKKPASRGRKKGVSNRLLNHLSKPVNATSTNRSITEYFPVRRSVRKCKKTVLEEKQRDIENKVVCQVEEGLEVRHFPGKGRGVITTREFAKGEYVVEYIGELISQAEAKIRENEYAQDQNTGCYMYYFQHRNQQYCVDATAETDKLGRLVNHSRNGNLIARIIEVNSIPHLVLTAKEDIPIGVEVTYDYGDRSRESIRHYPWLAL